MVDDEAALTAAIIALAVQYGRYGYRRITALLRLEGWAVNVKRVERIWPREGLKVPAHQPKRARLRLDDGSCLRLRPERPDHVWSYDFVEHRTHNGRKCRMTETPSSTYPYTLQVEPNPRREGIRQWAIRRHEKMIPRSDRDHPSEAKARAQGIEHIETLLHGGGGGRV